MHFIIIKYILKNMYNLYWAIQYRTQRVFRGYLFHSEKTGSKKFGSEITWNEKTGSKNNRGEKDQGRNDCMGANKP